MTRPQQTLAERFARREEQASTEIFNLYGRRMFSVAFGMLRDHDLARDAVQVALFNAWRAAATFDPERPIEPWLFAITRRAAIDVHRRNSDRHRLWPLNPAELDSYHPMVDGEEEATQAWVVWQVRAAVDRLSPMDQKIIKLGFLDELTHREIAERINIPIGTVKSRMFRAQRRLAELLQHLSETETSLV